MADEKQQGYTDNRKDCGDYKDYKEPYRDYHDDYDSGYDYSSGYGGMYGGHHPGDLRRAIRTDIIGELHAINQYEAHIEEFGSDPVARRVWEHIIMEEKEHVVELFYVLNRLDREQAEAFRRLKVVPGRDRER